MSSSESDMSDDGWEDMEDGDDCDEMSFSMPCQCLFCPDMQPSSEHCFNHMQKEHKFDFVKFVAHLKLDSYMYIKFVNYIRKAQVKPESVLQLKLEDFSSDEFLIPGNPEDGLLMLDVDELLDSIKDDDNMKVDASSSDASLEQQLKKSEKRASNAEQMLECAIADLNACKL